ncbi:hypothetical protein LTR33_017420, partial [Friedmanniomyces endolithicus]
RHPNLKPRRVRALDWKRHDRNSYHKIVEWFAVVRQELSAPVVRLENVYNMDETGILLNAPTSLKVLTDRDDTRTYRGASIQRVLVTAIECVLADGGSLAPMII